MRLRPRGRGGGGGRQRHVAATLWLLLLAAACGPSTALTIGQEEAKAAEEANAMEVPEDEDLVYAGEYGQDCILFFPPEESSTF